MNSNVAVVGLQEVIASLRQAGDPQRVDFELHASLAPVVGRVRNRAQAHARALPTSTQSRSEGALAGSLRVAQLKNGLSVRTRDPKAGPQEFGRHWRRKAHQRKNPSGGATSEVREHDVTMHDQSTPRYLYRAANELDGDIARSVQDGLDLMFRALGAEVTGG